MAYTSGQQYIRRKAQMAAYLHAMSINRRQLLQSAGVAGLGLLVGCGGLPGQAPPAKVPRVGYLILGTAQGNAWLEQEFRAGLRELGYVEGQNLIIEARYADNVADRLPELAAELVGLPVDVLVPAASQPSLAAQQATRNVPIVMAHGGDPVANGLVRSLAHPGGNVTGMTTDVIEGPLWGKRVELLRDTVPHLARLAILWYSENPPSVLNYGVAEQAARALQVEVQSRPVRAGGEILGALAVIAREPSDALLVVNTPIINSQHAAIAAFALSQGLPSISGQTTFTHAGGLMVYGPSFTASHRRAAYYVDRILKGTKPADLPVEQPREFEFVINLQTAQALGLTIPQHVLLQATEIIQ
jgi:putative tryptophan/tyrosine transport system substrate-binding protein